MLTEGFALLTKEVFLLCFYLPVVLASTNLVVFLPLPFIPIVTSFKIFSNFDFSQKHSEQVMWDKKRLFSINDDITRLCVLRRSSYYTLGKKPIFLTKSEFFGILLIRMPCDPGA